MVGLDPGVDATSASSTSPSSTSVALVSAAMSSAIDHASTAVTGPASTATATTTMTTTSISAESATVIAPTSTSLAGAVLTVIIVVCAVLGCIGCGLQIFRRRRNNTEHHPSSPTSLTSPTSPSASSHHSSSSAHTVSSQRPKPWWSLCPPRTSSTTRHLRRPRTKRSQIGIDSRIDPASINGTPTRANSLGGSIRSSNKIGMDDAVVIDDDAHSLCDTVVVDLSSGDEVIDLLHLKNQQQQAAETLEPTMQVSVQPQTEGSVESTDELQEEAIMIKDEQTAPTEAMTVIAIPQQVQQVPFTHPSRPTSPREVHAATEIDISDTNPFHSASQSPSPSSFEDDDDDVDSDASSPTAIVDPFTRFLRDAGLVVPPSPSSSQTAQSHTDNENDVSLTAKDTATELAQSQDILHELQQQEQEHIEDDDIPIPDDRLAMAVLRLMRTRPTISSPLRSFVYDGNNGDDADDDDDDYETDDDETTDVDEPR